MKYPIVISLALIVISSGCNNTPSVNSHMLPSAKKQIQDTSLKYENRYFPTDEHPVAGTLVVFFNSRSCPSCIIDINSYINVLKRTSSINAQFCTNIENTNLRGLDKIIASLQRMKVSPVFADLDHPVIFETDREGRVMNSLQIDPANLQVSFNYLNKYASSRLISR